MAKKRIIVLGAGLAGLSTAWHLQKSGLDCQVFEKELEVGGLCRSKNINGFIFDYDGHLLHFRHRYAFNFIKGLLGSNLARHQKNAWIYAYKRYIRYPFQANLYCLPPTIIKECLSGLIQVSGNKRIRDKDGFNFSEWIRQSFGKGIARHFMVPYNTKFWTVPPEELTCEWLDGFIPVPSLKQVIEGALKDRRKQFGYANVIFNRFNNEFSRNFHSDGRRYFVYNPNCCFVVDYDFSSFGVFIYDFAQNPAICKPMVG